VAAIAYFTPYRPTDPARARSCVLRIDTVTGKVSQSLERED